MSITPTITFSEDELKATSIVKKEATQTFFPPEYIMPKGYYQCLITSWNVESFDGKNKLILELLPLDHWEMSNTGKRKELFNTLEYKGRFPLCYVWDFEGFVMPKGDSLKNIHKLVKAVNGKLETTNDYLLMFNKLVGSQVIFCLSSNTNSKGRSYMVFDSSRENILAVEDEDKIELPTDYNSEDNGSVIIKGTSPEQGWLSLMPKEDIPNLIRYSLLPNTEYIYLLPEDGAGGVGDWSYKIKPSKKFQFDQQDKFIKFQFSFLNKKGLNIFYIAKAKDATFNWAYPSDLQERAQAFEAMGLKPVSKEWLWNVIKSGGNVYSQVDKYFEENMPSLFFKKEFVK